MEDILRRMSTLTLLYILEELLDLEPQLSADPSFYYRIIILDELKRRAKNSVHATSPAE